MSDQQERTEGRRRHTPCAGDGPTRKSKRFPARLKSSIVLRLLRGEDPELLSREYVVIAAAIFRWRDDFLAGGETAMKRREEPENEEIMRLRQVLRFEA